MVHLAYVDNSNLTLEGQRVSALRRGLAKSHRDSRDRSIIDPDWRLDFHRLHEFLLLAGPPRVAVVFGSVTQGNEGVWGHARAAGFETVLFERAPDGREKKVDTAVVTRACRDAYRFGDPRRDRITLVAGDGDYVPLVEQLRHDGFWVTVAFWGRASRMLREVATEFVPLDRHLDALALGGPASHVAGGAH